MVFFTLIHICKEESSIHNNSFTASFDEQVSLYLTCACQLHHSLAPEGNELIILTNDKPFLQRLNKADYPIEIRQLQFDMQVPSGIKFYSAHYKLEVFSYLASLADDYVALVDSDMICINKMPEALKTCIAKKLPLYYDITDQVVPAYGEAIIVKDKSRISGNPSVGLWAGGEFIAGPPAFFSTLAQEINCIKANYLLHVASFHHQGDEVLTSVAIENLKQGNWPLLDAGALSIVGRYWSYIPLHVQKPLAAFSAHFLLHLPSDKKFLSGIKPGYFNAQSFLKKYRRHLYRARTFETIFKHIKPYAKRLRKTFAR